MPPARRHHHITGLDLSNFDYQALLGRKDGQFKLHESPRVPGDATTAGGGFWGERSLNHSSYGGTAATRTSGVRVRRLSTSSGTSSSSTGFEAFRSRVPPAELSRSWERGQK